MSFHSVYLFPLDGTICLDKGIQQSSSQWSIGCEARLCKSVCFTGLLCLCDAVSWHKFLNWNSKTSCAIPTNSKLSKGKWKYPDHVPISTKHIGIVEGTTVWEWFGHTPSLPDVTNLTFKTMINKLTTVSFLACLCVITAIAKQWFCWILSGIAKLAGSCHMLSAFSRNIKAWILFATKDSFPSVYSCKQRLSPRNL